jgi:hypothetical protein
MRRAFKVATVFTGAAAAVAAFTPAAEAATAAGAQRMEPTTSLRNCNGNIASTTSMVFMWPVSKHHGPTCIGDGKHSRQGDPVHPDTNYGNYCAGNNFGFLLYDSGRQKSFAAGSPGRAGMPTSGLGGAFVSFVSISAFRGSIRCRV